MKNGRSHNHAGPLPLFVLVASPAPGRPRRTAARLFTAERISPPRAAARAAAMLQPARDRWINPRSDLGPGGLFSLQPAIASRKSCLCRRGIGALSSRSRAISSSVRLSGGMGIRNPGERFATMTPCALRPQDPVEDMLARIKNSVH
jgi:hypothetical protein